jgi:hypothetical protein
VETESKCTQRKKLESKRLQTPVKLERSEKLLNLDIERESFETRVKSVVSEHSKLFILSLKMFQSPGTPILYITPHRTHNLTLRRRKLTCPKSIPQDQFKWVKIHT